MRHGSSFFFYDSTLRRYLPSQVCLVLESWPSGLRHRFGEPVYSNVSWVRIPHFPHSVDCMITFYYNSLRVDCTEDNTHIESSYKVKKISAMRALLESHRGSPVYSWLALTKRSVSSMIMEWRAYNLLHALGIARSRTESVDLDYPQAWYYKVGYFVLGCFYPRF